MSRNKKLATLGASIAVVAAAIAMTAGTYSYFSDSRANAPVTTQAGSLRVGIDGLAKEGAVNIANFAPGQSVVYTFTVENNGSLDGRLTLRLETTDAMTDTLDNALTAKLTTQGDSGTLAENVTLNALTATTRPAIDAGAIAARGEAAFQLRLTFPNGDPLHDNRFQGKQTSFSVTALLDQDTSAS